MRFLLDVSALLALGTTEHEFHRRLTAWLGKLRSEGRPQLLTCSITELGFVRILAQTPVYGFTTQTARMLLARMKTDDPTLFAFIPDGNDISKLPGWVKYPRQITDGHLVQLAKAHGAILATLDTSISGAYVIPLRN